MIKYDQYKMNEEAKAKVTNIYICLKHLAKVDKKDYYKNKCPCNSAREIYQLIKTSFEEETDTNFSWLDVCNKIQERVKRSDAANTPNSPFYSLYKVIIENNTANYLNNLKALASLYEAPFNKLPDENLLKILSSVPCLDRHSFFLAFPLLKKRSIKYLLNEDQCFVHAQIPLNIAEEAGLFEDFSQEKLIDAFAITLNSSRVVLDSVNSKLLHDDITDIKKSTLSEAMQHARISVHKHFYLILGINKKEMEEKIGEEKIKYCGYFDLNNILRHISFKVYLSSYNIFYELSLKDIEKIFGPALEKNCKPILLNVDDILKRAREVCSYYLMLNKPPTDQEIESARNTVFVYNDKNGGWHYLIKWVHFLPSDKIKEITEIRGEISNKNSKEGLNILKYRYAPSKYTSNCEYLFAEEKTNLKELLNQDPAFARDFQTVCPNPSSSDDEPIMPSPSPF